MFEKLMARAKELEKNLCTEWADENVKMYDDFAECIEDAWDRGELTDNEFNELALTAFYDYPDGLKGEEED